MRQQRPMMIATVQQYIYFHNLVDVILERDDYEVRRWLRIGKLVTVVITAVKLNID